MSSNEDLNLPTLSFIYRDGLNVDTTNRFVSESKTGLFLFLANKQYHTSRQEHILSMESPGFR